MRINSKNLSWLSRILAVTLLLCICKVGRTEVHADSSKRMNVLFIAVDDLRPELGCYGQSHIQSPNIDKLASQGTVFNRAYCQQAVCGPSRASLLTGARPDTTKVYDLKTHFRKAMPDVVTLPQLFKENGYTSIALGKIQHGPEEDDPSWSEPMWHGRGHSSGKYGYLLPENQKIVADLIKKQRSKQKGNNKKGKKRRPYGPPYENADVPDNHYGDGVTADKAIEYLNKLKNKPFFLGVGFRKPHLAFLAPKKYYDLYDEKDIKLPDNMYAPEGVPDIAMTNWGELRTYYGVPKKGPLSEEMARKLIHCYYASVSYVDAQVGRVIAELERLGLRENTIIVLWGDHGWQLGEHGLWAKHTNFEVAARAPLIFSVPGQKSTGIASNALVEFVDIYPTIAVAAGLKLPTHLEGDNLLALLDDPKVPWKKAAFSQYPRGGGVMGYSMRTDRYRYTRWVVSGSNKVEARELYDHKTDPDENINIAGKSDNVKIVKQLDQQMNANWQGARQALHQK
ncbi:MAG: sulfatase [Phycisphaeraceae bacterium]|nr:sulfatase [Phycisphaeraceae bacterium]